MKGCLAGLSAAIFGKQAVPVALQTAVQARAREMNNRFQQRVGSGVVIAASTLGLRPRSWRCVAYLACRSSLNEDPHDRLTPGRDTQLDPAP